MAEHIAEGDAKEARFNLAKATYEDCAMWADQAQKETTFYVQWMEGDRPIATQHFKVSPLNDGIDGLPVDGSTESILANLQAANLRKDEEIIKIMQAVSNMLVQQAETSQAVIEHRMALERENLQLKEMLIEKNEDDSEWKKEVLGVIKGFVPALVAKNPTSNVSR